MGVSVINLVKSTSKESKQTILFPSPRPDPIIASVERQCELSDAGARGHYPGRVGRSMRQRLRSTAGWAIWDWERGRVKGTPT